MYVVTGASRGIGRAVAVELARRGMEVVAVARSAALLEELKGQFPKQIKGVTADIASREGLEALGSALKGRRTWEGIVHAAGTLIYPATYQEMDTQALVDHFRVHVAGPIGVYRKLRELGEVRRMLFVDSYSATCLRVGWGAYSIVKAGAQMAARCATEELEGTLCIRVFPGAVKTEVVDVVVNSEAEASRVYKSLLAEGKVAEPEDVARFMVALLVDAHEETLRSEETWIFNQDDHMKIVAKLQSSDKGGS